VTVTVVVVVVVVTAAVFVVHLLVLARWRILYSVTENVRC